MPAFNHATGSNARALRPMDGGGAHYQHCGYEDARRGLPFRRAYDTWPEPEQRNYERGRQIWADVHCCGGGTDKDMRHTAALPWRRNMYGKTHLDRAYGVPGRHTKMDGFLVSPARFRDMTAYAYSAWFTVEMI